MKPTEKIEINVNVIFSIKNQKFFIDVRRYTIIKKMKFIKSESICFTEIIDINEASNCIEKNNLVKRETASMYVYENYLDLKNQ